LSSPPRDDRCIYYEGPEHVQIAALIIRATPLLAHWLSSLATSVRQRGTAFDLGWEG